MYNCDGMVSEPCGPGGKQNGLNGSSCTDFLSIFFGSIEVLLRVEAELFEIAFWGFDFQVLFIFNIARVDI